MEGQLGGGRIVRGWDPQTANAYMNTYIHICIYVYVRILHTYHSCMYSFVCIYRKRLYIQNENIDIYIYMYLLLLVLLSLLLLLLILYKAPKIYEDTKY